MHADREKTKAYYSSLGSDALCDCAYCRNYYAQVKDACPRAAAFLASLGVDMEKPMETSPLEPENGFLTYCSCQYPVFGTCPDSWEHQIGQVQFRKAVSYPEPGIDEPCFVLDVYPIRLKFPYKE